MKRMFSTLVLMILWAAMAQAGQTWPHPIPCRVQDSDNNDLFVMTLGDVDTAMAQGTFDPVKDEVTLTDGTVMSDYFKETLDLPYFQPVDKTHYPLPPSGWCTWYYYYYHITADEVKLNAQWISDHLKDYGASVIQIDDGWQRGPHTTRDWTELHEGYFPDGMADVADFIKSVDLVPGIWIAPHGQDNPEFIKSHPNVFLLDPNGNSASETWEGKWLMDPTTDASETYFKELFQMMCDWGYDYFKIDGQPLVVDEYDNKQEFMAHKPDATGAELYRTTLDWIRDVIGEDRYLLGCWGIPTQGAGIMNGSRTGGDIVLGWGGFHTALDAVMKFYYQHNVMWYVDPDVMVLRSPLTLEQARVWATLQGLTGQALMATDRMPDLGEQRVEMLRRVYPAVDIRPLDLFPADHNKRIWDLKVNHLGRAYDVVGVFNFDEDKNQTTHLKWSDLGLDADTQVHVFDFWNQDFLGTWQAGMTLDVAPTSCRVLTLMPDNGEIQLLSTNRHITQGWVDLTDLSYYNVSKTYRGQSHIIKNDPYELRFVFPKGTNYRVKKATVQCGDMTLPVTVADHQGWSQVTVHSFTTTEVTWSVQFEPAVTYNYPTRKPDRIRFAPLGDDGVEVRWSEQYYLNNGYQVYLDGVLQGYTPKASFPLTRLNPDTEYTVSIETVWEDGSASQERASRSFTPNALPEDRRPSRKPSAPTVTGRTIHSQGNPIVADGSYYLADAAPLSYDGKLYIYGGHDQPETWQGGFVMKEYGVLETSDLTSGEWKLYEADLKPGEVFDWATGNNAYAGQVAIGADGRFYWYTPVEWKNTEVPNRMVIGVAVSDSPVGPWSDAIGKPLVTWLDVFGNDRRGQEVIDPHVFTDTDGSVYLYWGSWYVTRVVKLKASMTEMDGDIVTLRGLQSFFEAPWVFKRGETYYMAYDWKRGGSEWTPSNYQAAIGYATASSPFGPWQFQGIILSKTSATTVHPSIVEHNGRWWITYHTKDSQDGGHFRRSVAIDEVHWDGDKMLPVQQTWADDPALRLTQNLGVDATAQASFTEQPPMTLRALNDGLPETVLLPPDMWGNYRGKDNTIETDWIQYTWQTPVRIDGVGIQFSQDHNWIRPPAKWRVEYQNEKGEWTPVNLETYPTQVNQWLEVEFPAVTTQSLRAVFWGRPEGNYFHSVAATEWDVYAQQADQLTHVTVETPVGTLPQLPTTVELPFGDTTQAVPVIWRDVEAQQVKTPGSFTVEGRAIGQGKGFIKAEVTVK